MLIDESQNNIGLGEDYPKSIKGESLSSYLPITRYYGSKRRVIDWVKESVSCLEFDSVLDVFGGTATVSLMFKAMGKKVFYNDILMSSSLQAKALLSNHNIYDFDKTILGFCESVVPERGFITKNFADVYFTDDENSWLDGAMTRLESIKEEQRYAEVFYCLQQSCVQKRPFNLFHRKNHYLRVNNNRKTKFGNWVTWERSFNELMLRAAKELEKTRYRSLYAPTVLPCTNAIDVNSGYDLVYLDPPYIPLKRKDISYLERYHFLEGLASPEIWSSRIDWSKDNRGFKPVPEFMQWNTRSLFKENLLDLVYKHRESIVVLSYVFDAYPSLTDLQEFFYRTFKEVRVHTKELSHALAKNKKIELLIIGIPKHG